MSAFSSLICDSIRSTLLSTLLTLKAMILSKFLLTLAKLPSVKSRVWGSRSSSDPSESDEAVLQVSSSG